MFGAPGLESGDPANTDDPTDIPWSSANQGQGDHEDDLSTDNKIDTASEPEEHLLVAYLWDYV